MNDMVETEVKIHVPDLDAIRSRLEAAGATLTHARVYEHNVRYENADHSLTPNNIVLRLRYDTRARLTYKEPPAASHSHPADLRVRFEAEVTVDDCDTMDLILQRLGYHPHVVYEKYRTTYHLDTAEIVLDEMPFGSFVEVEGAPNAIRAALAALDLHDAPRILEGYMELFERIKADLDLTMHDLTFANFKAVEVPPEVFRRGAS
jgi:adenylate cyclase class 2